VNWFAWDPAPFVLAGSAVALARFADAFLRLRRRGRTDHASWQRAALFVLAVALGTLALISPLDEAGDTYLISAHMLQHLLLADVAPALALVALRGPLLFFFLPSPILRRVSRSSTARAVLRSLLRPRISIAVWACVIGAWHLPAVYDYTLTHPTVHDIEHLSFITVGLLAWTQIIDPARHKTLTLSQRLGCLAAMAGFALALGGILLLTGPLYPAYAQQPIRLFGLTPDADQQLAGLLMIIEQLAMFALCSALLLPARSVARTRRERRHRPADALL
jgi:cytochrome c oxidase assembly factor CtaG